MAYNFASFGGFGFAGLNSGGVGLGFEVRLMFVRQRRTQGSCGERKYSTKVSKQLVLWGDGD